MKIEAPSLDSFLKVHKLTIASFDGLSTEAALRLADLDDRSLERLGDGVRERALIVRGALIERLRLAERNDESDPDHEDDYSDGGDDRSPGKPTDENRKGKKKSKPKADDNEEDDEGNPAPDQAPKPDDVPDRRPAPPKDASISDYERSCKAMADAIVLAHRCAHAIEPPAQHRASDDAVLLTEVNLGIGGSPERIAAQICAADRKARGQVSPPLPPRGSPAHQILRAYYESIGRRLEG